MSAAFNAGLITAYKLFVLGARATYATAALVSFEYLISFKYEMEFLWERKWSAATLIFFSNRYLLMANIVSSVTSRTPQVCSNSRLMSTWYFLSSGQFSVLPAHVFSILRTFGLLQDHSWRRPATYISITLALTSLTFGSYLDFTKTWIYVEDPILGSLCVPTSVLVTPNTITRVNLVTSAGSAMLSESFVLAITLTQTFRQVKQATRFGLKTTLSEVLLRDGSLFFLTVQVLSIMSVIVAVNGLLFNESVTVIGAPLLNILPQLLLSRFIINLRQADGSHTSTGQYPSRFTVPDFRMPTMDDVIGNLGEPLDFAEYPSDKDAQDDDTNASENAEQQDATRTSQATGVADVEAASPFNTGCSSADTEAPSIDGIALETGSPSVSMNS